MNTRPALVSARSIAEIGHSFSTTGSFSAGVPAASSCPNHPSAGALLGSWAFPALSPRMVGAGLEFVEPARDVWTDGGTAAERVEARIPERQPRCGAGPRIATGSASTRMSVARALRALCRPAGRAGWRAPCRDSAREARLSAGARRYRRSDRAAAAGSRRRARTRPAPHARARLPREDALVARAGRRSRRSP